MFAAKPSMFSLLNLAFYVNFNLQGLGTDDRTLIRIMVTRSEIDMVQIKQEFRKKYGKTLHSFIAVSRYFLLVFFVRNT